MKLSPIAKKIRIRRFVKYFVQCSNGAKAARLAGYNESGSSVVASKLLKDPKIRLMIDKLADQVEVTPKKIKEEMAKMAFGTVKGPLNHNTKSRNLESLAKIEKMMVDRVEVTGLVDLPSRILAGRERLNKKRASKSGK